MSKVLSKLKKILIVFKSPLFLSILFFLVLWYFSSSSSFVWNQLRNSDSLAAVFTVNKIGSFASVAVIIAVRSTVQEPRAPIELRVATCLRRADSIHNRRAVVAADAVERRVRQRFGGGVRRSGRRVCGAGRRRRRRWNRRSFLHRFRRRENGFDLQRMRQFQRGTVVFFDYIKRVRIFLPWHFFWN